jgi:hypothetical protein
VVERASGRASPPVREVYRTPVVIDRFGNALAMLDQAPKASLAGPAEDETEEIEGGQVVSWPTRQGMVIPRRVS